MNSKMRTNVWVQRTTLNNTGTQLIHYITRHNKPTRYIHCIRHFTHTCTYTDIFVFNLCLLYYILCKLIIPGMITCKIHVGFFIVFFPPPEFWSSQFHLNYFGGIFIRFLFERTGRSSSRSSSRGSSRNSTAAAATTATTAAAATTAAWFFGWFFGPFHP